MASVIGDFVCSTRNFISQGFRSLPVIIGGASLTLGMTQANFNFLFFFVGMMILMPLTVSITNGLWELLFANTPVWLTVPKDLWQLPEGSAEACSLFLNNSSGIPQTINVVPSYWMGMIAFFLCYLFQNAYNLYVKQPVESANVQAVMARKSQSLISMIVIGIVAIVFTTIRYGTSCETGLGIFLSWLLAWYISKSWYKFMRICGVGRLDDLFGINNRILPLQSYEENTPTVCVPEK